MDALVIRGYDEHNVTTNLFPLEHGNKVRRMCAFNFPFPILSQIGFDRRHLYKNDSAQTTYIYTNGVITVGKLPGVRKQLVANHLAPCVFSSIYL
jgi:hypothetical protein